MYAKLINGSLERLRMPLKIGGNDVFTNDDNIIKANGYKPVVYTENIDDNAVPYWEETDTEITQVWKLNEGGVTE